MTESIPEQVADDGACYHCGLPIPVDVIHWVTVAGVPRRMCCIGCEAVAQSIVDGGLTEYYRHRDALPESRREALPRELQELGLFDHPDFQKSFVRPVGAHEREASLILEGITCGACVWLNEQHVARQPGVSAVNVNYATRRARVRWDERQARLSDILAAIQAIGYRAYPYDAERMEQVATRERRSALWRLFVAGFGMMQVMMYAVPAYIAGEGDMTPDVEQLLRWASLILTVPVMFYSSAPFFLRAWRDVRLRRLGMDVPVALGVGAAFLASCWATLTGGGEVYFDSVTMFVFFLLSGRYLEMVARQRAVRGVEDLAKVIPAFAERLPRWPDLASERVAVSELVCGDMLRVRPGEVIPADGVVVEGVSEANEALLTGESLPVTKRPGAAVTGGSINIASPLVIRLEQVGDRTRLAAIGRLMERAAMEKPRVVEQADRVAGWFIAGLIVLAGVAGVGWYLIEPSRALWIFVSVLVVSCPCALSLATPAALTVATDSMARLGVLVTRGHAIETLAKANRFAFDKTGTLTYGRMVVDETVALGRSKAQVLAVAAGLERASEHAIAAGIRREAGAVDIRLEALASVTGQGVEGRLDGQWLRLGQVAYVEALVGTPLPSALSALWDAAGTVVVLGSAGHWWGGIRLADTLRPEVDSLMVDLRGRGCELSILSGDGVAVVEAVAQRLGITDFHGGMSPQSKHGALLGYQRQGDVVAMVGDGVNDAPVLAQAQISIAMGGGTDLARNQADLVLLSETLAPLAPAVKLASRTLRIIRQNLWWAFAYNFTAIPLAMLGWVTPWMAGVGMSASSLLVVLNAMRLRDRDR